MSRICLLSLAALLACTRAYEDKPVAPQTEEQKVVATEGGTATLRCPFHGNPPPKITWRFRGHIIDGNADRYRLMADGALEINPLYRSDTGVYFCMAENSLGVDLQEVPLVVNDVLAPHQAVSQKELVASEGSIATLRCLFPGNPTPKITWKFRQLGCNKLCDEGKQTRQVKPEEGQPCMLQPCDGVDWVTSSWSGCDSCTSKFRTRTVVCATKSWQLLNESFCSHINRPADHEECDKEVLPGYEVQWYATQWSKCSVNCGDGVQTREVFCGMSYNDESGQGVDVVEDAMCANFTKYNDAKPCTVPKQECPSQWLAGPWSACSEGCGGGEQYRRVKCFRGDKEATDCDNTAVLETMQHCNTGPCHPEPTMMTDDLTTLGGSGSVNIMDTTNSDSTTDDYTGSGETSLTTDVPSSTASKDKDTPTMTAVIPTSKNVPGDLQVVPRKEPDMTASEGEEVTIDGNAGRYRLMSDGALQIVSLYRNDTGIYICVADNDLEVATQEIHLTVNDPVRMPARIAGVENATAIGDLGSPFHVRCLVYGHPPPSVSWYRDYEEPMALDNDTEHDVRGNDLTFRSLSVDTLGQYSCRAYNEVGKASSRFVVRAYMPVWLFIENKFLVLPQDTVANKPRKQPPINVTTSTTTTTTIEVTRRLFFDPVRMPARIAGVENATVIGNLGSPFHVRCLAYGHPPPSVSWYRDYEEPMALDNDTEHDVRGNDLTFRSLSVDTLGQYSCRAYNEVGKASSRFVVRAYKPVWLFIENKFLVLPQDTVANKPRKQPPINVTTSTTTTTTIEVTRRLFFDPVRMPARIAGVENATVIGNLGSPFHVRCLAYGHPPPSVSWYREYEEPMALDNDTEHDVRGNDLTFRSLSIDTLGQYSCRANNEVGKVSWEFVVRAYKPVWLFIENKFLVLPEDTVVNRPRKQPPINVTTSTTNTTTTIEATRRLFIVNTTTETTESIETSEGSTTIEGTTDVIGTTALDPCSGFEFGCCADNETEASGPDGQGCPCNATEFGCCPDGVSPGCGCQYALHGCCPDNVTNAQGPDNQGCGCQYTQHGCCPDKHTMASGPNNEGCACNTYQFGCCADGVITAKGPEQQGCHCHDSKFGCCGDGETYATGPDAAGCDCSSSQHGCCPDGRTEATGPKLLGCTDAPENKQAACSMSTDPGQCHNFTVMWYYDLAYGGCSRFWYGGCDGNGNRFATKEDCEDVCVQPSPKDACKLPSVKGACDADYQRWHYNSTREQCIPFRYGGCLGNANNFDTRELCQKQCEPSSVAGQCNLPVDQGSCAGNYSRWGFNSEAHRCEQFIWGGCEGNSNRFSSEAACQMHCAGTQPLPDKCTLPAETGQCSNYRERWFYDTTFKRCRQFYYGGCGGNENNFDSEAECDNSCSEIKTTTTAIITTTTTTARPVEPQPQPRPAEPEQRPVAPERPEFCFNAIDAGPCNTNETRYAYDSELGRCVTFQYGGCGGNQNNFPDEAYCSFYCQPILDICQLPMLQGPCEDSLMRWFYDPTTDSCSQFTYGGCEGNDNRFESLEACENRCRTGPAPVEPTTPTTTAIVDGPSECRVPEALEDCRYGGVVWYFDTSRKECVSHANPEAGPVCRYTGTFLSQEACERSCGAFRGVDVCKQRKDPGPCRRFVTKVYFDPSTGQCREFMYGGCIGGANRFSSIEECSQICKAERGLVDPVRMAIGIAGDEKAELIGELGKPLMLRCRPYGDPPPYMSWYYGHEETMIPFNNTVYETRGNVLLIRNLTRDTLGRYTCQAYYGEGQVASRGLVVRAYMPEEPPKDSKCGTNVPRDTLAPRPGTPPLTTTETTNTTTTTTTEAPRPLITDPVSTHVSTLNAGADLHLTCEVDGFPEPDVHWTKDGSTIQSDGRITITGSAIVSRLTVTRVSVADSGLYACHASAQINVQQS